MIPQWDFFLEDSNLKRWQIHNHCFALRNLEGISGSKVSQWKHFKCMVNSFGGEHFSFMPDSYILPELVSCVEHLILSYFV